MKAGDSVSHPNEWNSDRDLTRIERESLIILAKSAGFEIYDFMENHEYGRVCVRCYKGEFTLEIYQNLIVSPQISYEEAITYLKNAVEKREI